MASPITSGTSASNRTPAVHPAGERSSRSRGSAIRRVYGRSAQDEKIEQVASRLRALAALHRTPETVLPAHELVVAEAAHRRVGLAERVHLAEEVREAARVRLANLLERLLPQSRRGEHVAGLREGREAVGRPGRLGEPADELHPAQPAREPLADEDGGAGAQHAPDLARAGRQVREVVADEGEPRTVGRHILLPQRRPVALANLL